MFSNRLQRALLTATSCINRSISPASFAPPHDLPSVLTVLQRRAVLGLFTEVTQFPVRLFWTTEYKLYKEGDEITQDTVLFEGCDYNHWLITMDFPKNHPLSPEEMVSTYEQTCATGLGIRFLGRGEEEIYACSTMT
uniref:MORF/ORRM1/DAG-like MORF domain-containing protein n=1 Tax=Brassica oleracea var. oleracea TaxID=109376 RepID=A0A0D3BKK1_BRAOL